MLIIKQLDASNPKEMITRMKDFICQKIGGFAKLFNNGDKLGNKNKISGVIPDFLQEKTLEPFWEEIIKPSLISNFGFGETLYVIFYLDKNQNEIIMEIWSPKYVNTKPSEVFVLELDVETVSELKSLLNLTENRSEAKRYVLNNWN